MDKKFQSLKNLFASKKYSEVVRNFTLLEVEERSLEDQFLYAWSLLYLKKIETSLYVTLELLSKDKVRASELLANIVAFELEDDIYLLNLFKSYPDNANICNVLAIRAVKRSYFFGIVVNLIPNFIGKKDTDSVKFLYHAAKMLVIKGNCNDALKAIDIFKKIERSPYLDPYYKGSVYYYLSLAYEKIGNVGRAQNETKRAKSLLKVSVNSDSRRKCKVRLGEIDRWDKKISRVKAC